MIFTIWTVIIDLLFVFLTYRTLRFKKHLLSLNQLPEKYKLTPFEKSLADTGMLWPKISIVIPACNEGETIQAAMLSLLMVDYPNLEIVVVNDRSNDKTRQIIDQLSLVDDRIRPVHVNYLPPGWLGKVNALERGMAMTTAEWVLFTDADVHFSEQSLKSAMAFCLKDQTDFLTLIPDVKTKSSLLHVVICQLFHQATLFFNPIKMNEPTHPACYGQGAFMLMRKSSYLKSERLEWLKMEVIDDTGLALMMRRAGARMAALAGKEQIQLEWYPSFKSFARGIEKNAFAFSQYSIRLLLGSFAAVLLIFFGFAIAPFLAGGTTLPIVTGIVMSVYLFAMNRQLNQILKIHWWTVFAFPFTFVFVPVLFLRAALFTIARGGVNWRGTFYDVSSLKANQKMKLANLVFKGPIPVPAATVEKVDPLEAEMRVG
jgi:glycosyltransferase involved in cell wall biosynthesis